jgi:cell division protease FtsH
MPNNPTPNKNAKKKKPGISFIPFLAFIFIFAALLSWVDFNQNKGPIILKYDDFNRRIAENKIKSADISDFKIVGQLIDGNNYEVVINPNLISDMSKKLAERNIPTQILPPKNTDVWGYVINIGGTILIIVFFWILLSKTMQSQGGGQIFNFGKSTAKMFISDGPKVSFKNVAGLHEAKQEMLEIVDFLREPKKFTAMGAKVPKGVLLVGPPGCGKTLMAKAISGEAKVPFFSVSGSEFVEMFVGVGASRVRDLFLQAKKFAPSLIFIDEIDAVGRQRGAGLGGGHDEREQTLNQLLVEMDGYDPHLGIIIIAATNRPDILDPALLRAGRFDRQIMVDMPNSLERDEILKLHAESKPIDSAVNLSIIARRTSGFTGADLENLLNEGAILATRREKKSIGMSEIEEAIDRVIAGPEKKTRVVSEKEKKSIAIHEAGHAALIRYFPDQEPVHKISIISRGMALGYTLQLPMDDKYLRSKTELMHMITALLGGRAAEEICIGDISTGAENDLVHATKIATDMVCKYGMSEKLGPRTFGKEHGPIFLGRDLVQEKDYSDETGRTIDLEVKMLVEDAYVEAKKVITEKKGLLLEMSEALISLERLEGDELEKYLTKIRPLSDDEKKKVNTI